MRSRRWSARVTGTYPSVEVTDDGTLSAADLQQLQSALDPLTAVTQTYRVTARNEVSDTEVSGTDDLEPAVGQIVSQLAGQAGGVALVYRARRWAWARSGARSRTCT